jgi:hypothetical protein
LVLPVHPHQDALNDCFTKFLEEITLYGRPSVVTSCTRDRVAPPDLPSLSSNAFDEKAASRFSLGMTVQPIYLEPLTKHLYPMVLRLLRAQLAKALRRAVTQFMGQATAKDVWQYESLGPSSLVKAARLIDQQLCEVGESFDFILQVTSTNTDQAWQEFRRSGYSTITHLNYRPLP